MSLVGTRPPTVDEWDVKVGFYFGSGGEIEVDKGAVLVTISMQL